MKKFTLILFLALVFLFAGRAFLFEGKPSPVSSEQKIDDQLATNDNPLGDWSGVLDVGIMKLTLILHVDKSEEGNLVATLDCLEQQLAGCSVDVITVQGDKLLFEVKTLMASFEGALINEEILGKFTQGQMSIPLSFKKGIATEPAYKRPQEPKAPYSYRVEEVIYPNNNADINLSGTLTLPNGQGPFPVAILIAGSGPMDRDETLLGHKPFLVLSDHLTKKGIAVLRVDKRGVGKSTGRYEAATSEDFASDVMAGIEFLKSREEILSNKMGLIGHSEGGLVAAIVGAQANDLAFIVSMAGPGVNGEEILFAQAGLIQRASGVSEEVIALERKLRAEASSVLKNESDIEKAKVQLHEVFARYLKELTKGLTEDQKEALNTHPGIVNEENFESFIDQFNTPWFRYFLTFEPSSALKKVKVPVLALNGSLDLQVPPMQNLPVIENALKEAGNQDYSIRELPGINHLFQNCQTGAIEEYAKIEETISPSVLDMISEWVGKRSSK